MRPKVSLGVLLLASTFVAAALGSEEVPRSFLDKLFYPWGVEAIFPEGLPSDWPENLPLPEGTTLLGSLKLGFGIYWVVFKAPGEYEEILTSYVGQLETLGWEVIPTEGSEEGSADTEGITFLKGPNGKYLLIASGAVGEGKGRIDLFYGYPAEEALKAYARLLAAPFQTIAVWLLETSGNVFPRFAFPRHIVTSFSGGPCAYSAETMFSNLLGTQVYNADLVTRATPEEILKMVTAQMEEAGWALTEQGKDGPILWARYKATFDSRPWEAILTLHAAGLPNTYHFTIHAFVAP